MNLVCVVIWLVAAAGQIKAAPQPTAIDRAFNRLYNCDFAGSHAILDEQIRIHPDDPLLYSVRAATYLYSEFHRLKILETDFFADDDRITDRKKLKPDPGIRAQLFQVTGEARKRAAARLAIDPKDRNAMFALCMASGVETDYTSLVEKKYILSYSLSKESQLYAHKLLSMDPPFYDAYLTLGSVEYVVGNLNFFFKLFIRFDQIEGSKQKAVEELKRVIDSGRYYPPFAKILLSVIYLRENQPQQALALLKQVQRDFPENPLIKEEVVHISEKLLRGQQAGGSGR
jgi:tetratricopeptide (TPR) repeat protein